MDGIVLLIHNHYMLGIKWVNICNTYYHEEARKFKDIVLNHNQCVVIVVAWLSGAYGMAACLTCM